MRSHLSVLIICMAILVSACDDADPQLPVKEESTEKHQSQAQDRTLIRVALTNSLQPPLTTESGGLSADILQALNAAQDTYYFEQTLVATLRYRELIKEQRIHMAAFSNLNWSWDKEIVHASLPMIHDRDIYIALNEDGHARMLNALEPTTSKAGVLGFHYRLVNFSKDQQHIKETQNMTLVENEMSVFNMVMLERAKMGIVSQSFLSYMQSQDAELKQRILVADEADSVYDRYYVLHKQAPISIEAFNQLLRLLHQRGTLKNIYDAYGLPLPQWTQAE